MNALQQYMDLYSQLGLGQPSYQEGLPVRGAAQMNRGDAMRFAQQQQDRDRQYELQQQMLQRPNFFQQQAPQFQSQPQMPQGPGSDPSGAGRMYGMPGWGQGIQGYGPQTMQGTNDTRGLVENYLARLLKG